jgi:hypothetical protein
MVHEYGLIQSVMKIRLATSIIGIIIIYIKCQVSVCQEYIFNIISTIPILNRGISLRKRGSLMKKAEGAATGISAEQPLDGQAVSQYALLISQY